MTNNAWRLFAAVSLAIRTQYAVEGLIVPGPATSLARAAPAGARARSSSDGLLGMRGLGAEQLHGEHRKLGQP